MHWYTFAANMARAIALVTAINVSLAVLLIFLARRERLSSLFCQGKNPGDSGCVKTPRDVVNAQ